MYAIVLTFDEQIGFAELTYKKYMELWPDCPLIFRVPYNNSELCKSYQFFKTKDNVELIKADKSIYQTMHQLLHDIPDYEWVLWCIDDRYLHSVYYDNFCKNYLDLVYSNINHVPRDIDRVKLIRWKEGLSDKSFKLGGHLNFLFEEPNSAHGGWHHSFTRARQLKWEFLRSDLGRKYSIEGLTYKGSNANRGFCSIVPNLSLVSFAEPCIRGEITPNGVNELNLYKCPVPEYNVCRYGKIFFDQGRVEKVYR